MEIFWILLSLLGGLSLFLFGMRIMGQGLERRAGARLKGMLGRLTSGRFRGLLLGLSVTALIQSSSAVTVMAVGFVNSGIMTLHQVTGVIMGANLGTTLTSWLLSLTQIQGDGFFLRMLKPASFSGILGILGIIFLLFSKKESRKQTGEIFLGFAVLMFGMEAMANAAEPLAAHPAFSEILLWIANPFFGIAVGALMTAILQSSSASVGVLQALSAAGRISLGAVVPIIMGQNIGTCVTAMLSSIGTGRNARRAAIVHLYFNLLGSTVLLPAFYFISPLFNLSLDTVSASPFHIALIHTLFNFLCVLLLFPFAGQLERLAVRTIPENERTCAKQPLLDERLLASPTLALSRSRTVSAQMARLAVQNASTSFRLLQKYDRQKGQELEKKEKRVDQMEDEIATYLISIGSRNLSAYDSRKITSLLHLIGDFERISDHALNLGQAAAFFAEPTKSLGRGAQQDVAVLCDALEEILALAIRAFCEKEPSAAKRIEPLEEVIDRLKEEIRARGIERLRKNEYSVEVGFLLSDILTDMERIADHACNIAQVLLSSSEQSFRLHEYQNLLHTVDDPSFSQLQREYQARFSLPLS